MTPHQETPPPVDPASTSDDPSLPPAEPSSPSSDQSEAAKQSHDTAVAEVTHQGHKEGGEEAEEKAGQEKSKFLTPYGLPCVRELLRFLVSIISTEEG